MIKKLAWKPMPAALALAMTLAALVAIADDADIRGALLTGALDLTYAGNLEKTDDAGRLLVWEGSVGGDFGGTIRWWFIDPSPIVSTTHIGGTIDYYEARWEIWVDEKLVLAGQSAGKTVAPDQSDGIWDGHGVVTEAYGEFARFKGRKVYETGPVIYGSNPPDSLTGTGMFQIY
jgi:hypothetical protein